MSTSIGTTLSQFTQQKSACEAELQKINVELGISDSNLKNLLAQAQEQFGTQDITMLNTILTNLTTEYDTLTNDLNTLNMNAQTGVGNNGAVGY